VFVRTRGHTRTEHLIKDVSSAPAAGTGDLGSLNNGTYGRAAIFAATECTPSMMRVRTRGFVAG
jgi:hypothetical protein